MKKLLIFGGIIVAIFALIIVLTNQSNKAKLEGSNNPYETNDLDQATIDQLDDPNYQNIILPDELEERIASGEPVTVYFFSPTCPHCQEMTPVLMPTAEEMGVDIVQYNLLEFEEGWNQYNIEYTPTMIHFENGQEVNRTVGSMPKENIELFFNQVVLN